MHILPKLPYAFDALEPHLDAKTLEVHHDKHHATYVAKLNEALEKHSALRDVPVEELLRDLAKVPKEILAAVKNHGGGHASHTLFWNIMAPNKGGEPTGGFALKIDEAFGSFAAFREMFTKATLGIFGSGWTWLVVDKDGKMSIMALPNQDNPLSVGFTPIMNCDAWEHAYYLKFQNRRPEYVEVWWNVVNWDAVNENYRAAIRSLGKQY